MCNLPRLQNVSHYCNKRVCVCVYDEVVKMEVFNMQVSLLPVNFVLFHAVVLGVSVERQTGKCCSARGEKHVIQPPE